MDLVVQVDQAVEAAKVVAVDQAVQVDREVQMDIKDLKVLLDQVVQVEDGIIRQVH